MGEKDYFTFTNELHRKEIKTPRKQLGPGTHMPL